MSSPAKSTFISINQAAFELGLNPKTIRRRIADGTLRAMRVVGTNAIRIRRSDLDALMRPVREV